MVSFMELTEQEKKEKEEERTQIEEIKFMLNACANMNMVTDDDDNEAAQEKNEQILSTFQILILTLEEQLIDLGHDLPSFFELINQQVEIETTQDTPRIINIAVEPISRNKPQAVPRTV